MERSIQILSTYPLSDPLIKNAQGAHQAQLAKAGTDTNPSTLCIEWTSTAFIQTQPDVGQKTAERIMELASKSITAIFTSAHGVQAVFSLLDTDKIKTADWQVYCLAGKTRDAVLQYLPASAIISVADYGKALAEKIAQLHTSDAKLYFFCGNIRMPTLPALLSARQIPLEEITVYHTALTPKKVNACVDGVLFFSPSAVRSFFELNQPDPTTILFSVGKTTSQAIGQYSHNQVITSPAPRVALVLQSVFEYFENNPPLIKGNTL